MTSQPDFWLLALAVALGNVISSLAMGLLVVVFEGLSERVKRSDL